MYYANISQFLFLRLEVITVKISLLSKSPTCALNGTHGGQGDGGTGKAIEVYLLVSKYYKMDVLVLCHVLKTLRIN